MLKKGDKSDGFDCYFQILSISNKISYSLQSYRIKRGCKPNYF